MNKSTRKLTLSALFSALAVISLYLASVWPTGQLGLAAVASLFVAAAIIESGLTTAAAVFVVSSLLAFLVVPNRLPLVLYICFFGYYPLIKSLIEKRGHIVAQLLGKLAVFFVSLTMTLFVLAGLLSYEFNANEYIQCLDSLDYNLGLILLYAGGGVVFLLYDHGFSKLIRFYVDRISKRIGNR